MNMEEFLVENGVQIVRHGEHHHTRPGWVQLDCPMCGVNSHRYHLGLNTSGGYFNCYKCGKLDRVDVVSTLLSVPPAKAAGMLRGVERQVAVSSPSKAVSRGKLVLPLGIRPLGQRHREYLESRRFDPDEIIEIWQVRAIIKPPFNRRIFIPIFAKDGEMVSWTTRSIDPMAHLRYISAKSSQEIYNHKTLLYGEHLCEDAICICEGPISAWAIGPGAVATCGLGYTQPQLVRMSKYRKRYVCFDAEPQAQRRAKKLCDSLSAFSGFTKNILLSAKDPAECSSKERREIKKLIRT